MSGSFIKASGSGCKKYKWVVPFAVETQTHRESALKEISRTFAGVYPLSSLYSRFGVMYGGLVIGVSQTWNEFATVEQVIKKVPSALKRIFEMAFSWAFQ
jgi:hypothetical protein